MKAGYCRVSTITGCKAAGKIRKIRCRCNTSRVNDVTGGKDQYFNNNETGFPPKYSDVCKSSLSDHCPVCDTFAWYTI